MSSPAKCALEILFTQKKSAVPICHTRALYILIYNKTYVSRQQCIMYSLPAAYNRSVVYNIHLYLYNDLFYYIISDADRHAISSKNS